MGLPCIVFMMTRKRSLDQKEFKNEKKPDKISKTIENHRSDWGTAPSASHRSIHK